MKRIAREKKQRLNEPIPPEQKNTAILDAFKENCGLSVEEFFAELKRRSEEERK